MLLLNNCSNINQRSTRDNAIQTPYIEPAEAYLEQARLASGEERAKLKIQAAGRLIYDRQIQDGVKLLKQTPTQNIRDADEKKLLLAKANLMVNNAAKATQYLSQIRHSQELLPFFQSLYRQLLIENYEQKGLPLQAIEERFKLNQTLGDAAEKRRNQVKIWQDFMVMPMPELQTLSIETSDPNIKGWASLAIMAKQTNPLVDIRQWQSTFPDHAANQLISHLVAPDLSSGRVKNIAILLPQSGSLLGPAQAIYEGISDAKQEAKGSVRLRIYDTSQKPVVEQYQKAVSEGADFIIGPVSKDNVAQIAKINHPVPTLMLNYTNGSITANAWQFGLSPEHEIDGLVDKLNKEGFQHPLVFAAKGRWGEQVLSTFTQKWQQQGHEITDKLVVSSQTNYNQAVRHFLNIDDSANREKKLRRIVGREVKGNLRRRQDFDVVVILTHSSKARQLVPLLKYYYLGSTPVYAISTVHSAERGVADNRDLDGVIFPDVAYIYQQDKLVKRHWSEKLNSYNRLFAIGRDSFFLSQNLPKVITFPAIPLGSQDDMVFLSKPDQISYELRWGQLVDGKAEKLV